MIFSDIQKKQLSERNTNEENILKQLQYFKNGFPPAVLVKPAIPGDGLEVIDTNSAQELVKLFDTEAKNYSIIKFVPASGAATRMFKSLYEFLKEKDKSKKLSSAHSQTHLFFYNIKKYAFYNDLKEIISQNGLSIDKLIETKEYDKVLNFLLDPNGLNYGSLPKGLLKFHSYEDISRTAFEEHLVEAALHANGKGNISIHFTVSHEHMSSFKKLADKVLPAYEKYFNTKYNISFSIQKPSTDTVSVDGKGNMVVNTDGSILFRPGGHGALLENLNDLDGDIIFIKNIDNVVTDHLRHETVTYKKIIAGLLIQLNRKVFQYQQWVDKSSSLNDVQIKEIIQFINKELKVDVSNVVNGKEHEFIQQTLFRPLRICGMVKNTGEPGGGPFWVKDSTGNISLQVVESSQVDTNNVAQKSIFSNSTHFNPVDIVCSTKNYKGEKYNLNKFRDNETGFITNTSVNGLDF